MGKVFIVDDEIGALTLVTIMLERGGYEVVKAENAAQALEKIDSDGVPDLFILDVMMPDMNGIELCKLLKNREDTQEVPVLILSARSDSRSVVEGIDAGATDYLLKPIFHNNLVEKVRGILGN